MKTGTHCIRPWQGALAFGVGLVVAGLPTPAVPVSVDDVAAVARIDDAGLAGEALATEAVLRLTAGRRWERATITAS